jgi:predicted GNAT family acetyltransferase
MQTNKEISDQMFDTAKTITNVSTTASLYGRLLAVKDMQIHLLKEENKLKEEIERNNESKRI